MMKGYRIYELLPGALHTTMLQAVDPMESPFYKEPDTFDSIDAAEQVLRSTHTNLMDREFTILPVYEQIVCNWCGEFLFEQSGRRIIEGETCYYCQTCLEQTDLEQTEYHC